MSVAPIVVDASVAVKWVLDEEYSRQALALLMDCFQEGRRMAAPPSMLAEATNAVYQRLRTTDPTIAIPAVDAAGAVQDLLDQPLEILAPYGLYERALQFAITRGLPSIYDALYVVLAELLGAELWTADQRLLSVLGGTTPWVQDIRQYPSA